MEQFLNEALKTGRGIELGDALKVGGMVTGVGLGIVFGVLIILMIVLMLFKVIFYRPEPKKQKAEPVKNEKVEGVPVSSEKPVDNDELIAVITAAVAASLNTSTYNLNIKSIRRVDNNTPAWNKAGLRDVLDSRY